MVCIKIRLVPKQDTEFVFMDLQSFHLRIKEPGFVHVEVALHCTDIAVNCVRLVDDGS